MANQNLTSPIQRARSVVEAWFELLPKDAKLDAQLALDKLCQTAEREVEIAYSDGMSYSYDCRRVHKHMEALAAPST